MVAAGILLSRIAGFARGAAVAAFLGVGGVADAWQAAFRIPNFLQNLFGEGALSASFIPVYAGLLGQGRDQDARRVAGAVAGLLAAVVSVLVLAGVLFTPSLISVIAPGFEADRRALTIALVRIIFPGTGLLVLSAWCLGILNSHGRFFLSYAAPIAWNVAIIVALFVGARSGSPDTIAIVAAWGAVIGSAAQLLVQLPAVMALVRGLRVTLNTGDPAVRTVISNFAPAFVTRGVTQISAYIDTLIASFLPLGAVASLGYAQLISTLPVSLFGMAVSAAELPAMSRSAAGDGPLDDAASAALRERLERGLRQIAYFVVPSAAAFLAIGHLVSAALFQSGRFTANDSLTVWSILAGSAVGLLASTMGRLYSSVFYALRDTRTPLRFAALRVALTIGLGAFAALKLPGLLGYSPRWGAAGLTASAGLAAWIEFVLLQRALTGRIGRTGVSGAYVLLLWAAALLSAGAAWVATWMLPMLTGRLAGMLAVAVFGLVYLAATRIMRVPEALALAERLRR